MVQGGSGVHVRDGRQVRLRRRSVVVVNHVALFCDRITVIITVVIVVPHVPIVPIKGGIAPAQHAAEQKGLGGEVAGASLKARENQVLASVFPVLNLGPRVFVDVVVNLQHGRNGLFRHVGPALLAHGVVELLFRRIHPVVVAAVVVFSVTAAAAAATEKILVVRWWRRGCCIVRARNARDLAVPAEREALIGLWGLGVSCRLLERGGREFRRRIARIETVLFSSSSSICRRSNRRRRRQQFPPER